MRRIQDRRPQPEHDPMVAELVDHTASICGANRTKFTTDAARGGFYKAMQSYWQSVVPGTSALAAVPRAGRSEMAHDNAFRPVGRRWWRARIGASAAR